MVTSLDKDNTRWHACELDTWRCREYGVSQGQDTEHSGYCDFV